MKHYLCFTMLPLIMLAFTGCKKDGSNPAAAPAQNIVASESWDSIVDGDSSNHSQHTFERKSDGSITTNGTWYYSAQGAEVQCSFTDGDVAVVDTVVIFTAQGTATNSAAPAGHQTSPFTFSTAGIAYNGKAYGTYSITFSTYGWPTNRQGIFAAKRMSGNGITK